MPRVKRRETLTFLSDYGLEDEFVGVCQGVILRIAPHVKIIHIHHNILRQSIRHGAIVLEQSIRFMPESVHLAVVDPSVGSERRAVVIESGWGEVFVGPDNGLLIPAAEQCGGVRRAFEILDRSFLLTPISRTFQGRDVFSPAAAHIANGVDPSELGPSIAVGDLVRLEIPDAWVHDDHLHAEVLQVDRFGNLQLNVGPEEIAAWGPRVSLRWGSGQVRTATRAPTYGALEGGQVGLVVDSYGMVSVVLDRRSAAEELGLGPGDAVTLGEPS